MIHDHAFNIGSSEQNVHILDLAEMLSARSGCEIELSGEASPDPRSYRVDFGERALPEFGCEWNVERGADELFSAYRDVDLTADDFAGSRYVRLRRIKELLDQGRLDASLRWVGDE